MAAVAVPSYTKYSRDAKIQSVNGVVTSILKRSSIYLASSPNSDISATKIGYLTDPPAGTSNVISTISIAGFFTCTKPGRVAQIVVSYDTYKLGISNTPGSIGRLVYFIYNSNSVTSTKCVNYDLLTTETIPWCKDDWNTTTTAVTATCT